MSLLACILLFFLMMLLPFVPGWIEMHRKRDDKRLYINSSYLRDPRFFSKSFRKKMSQNGESLETIEQHGQVVLSKTEPVLCGDELGNDKTEFEEMTIFLKSRELTQAAVFKKEVYAAQNIQLAKGTVLRALAAAQDCILGSGSRVIRWIDAENKLTLENGCQTDLSATAGKLLILGEGCRFKRLYAPLIQIAAASPWKEEADILPDLLTDHSKKTVMRDIDKVEAGKQIFGDIVSVGTLQIGAGCVIAGSIRAEKGVEIDTGAIVTGNIFSDGDICLRQGAKVKGTIFTQGKIMTEDQCRIGTWGKISSIIARKGIRFSHDIVVFGYVSTEGEGLVI